MKLSDVKDEEALDLLANILDPLSVIMTDKDFVDIIRSGKPKLLAAKTAIKSHKKELIEVIAAMHEKSPEEYHFTVISLTRDVLDILNDPELQVVFTSQSQMMPGESFGSATENIEESEK